MKHYLLYGTLTVVVLTLVVGFLCGLFMIGQWIGPLPEWTKPVIIVFIMFNLGGFVGLVNK